MQMKRLEISLLLALVFCALVSFLSVNEEYDHVRENVLRLHILANSDSPADQELKLKVRNALQSETDSVFGECKDIDQALEAAEYNSAMLQEAAERTLRMNGCGYPVAVGVEKCYFPTRTYNGVTMPAGMYNAIRVEIGEAQGQNWWCVMFPAMCVTGRDSRAELETVLTGEQLSLLESDGYEVRFRCVEWYEQLRKWMSI